jgi:deazaflavin-dependent oxidoreductase (nitroreductase family)
VSFARGDAHTQSKYPYPEQLQTSKMTATADPEQCLYLTTRGRRSGLPREIEIWFTRRDNRYYVIAEYATSQWVQNLNAHPEVEVRVAGNSFAAHARALAPGADGPLIATIQGLSRQKYGWDAGLVVELTSIATAESDEEAGR